MSTATIVKFCVILVGVGIMAITFVLHGGKETDSKSGGYLGTAWYSCNFKRCSSEVFRMEQPIKSWKSCGASYNCISGIMGCLSDDDTNFFTDYEKSGTCNTGFAFKSGE